MFNTQNYQTTFRYGKKEYLKNYKNECRIPFYPLFLIFLVISLLYMLLQGITYEGGFLIASIVTNLLNITLFCKYGFKYNNDKCKSLFNKISCFYMFLHGFIGLGSWRFAKNTYMERCMTA